MKKDRWMARSIILAVIVSLFLTGVTDKTTDVEAKVVSSGYGHTGHTLVVGESYLSLTGAEYMSGRIILNVGKHRILPLTCAM